MAARAPVRGSPLAFRGALRHGGRRRSPHHPGDHRSVGAGPVPVAIILGLAPLHLRAAACFLPVDAPHLPERFQPRNSFCVLQLGVLIALHGPH